MTLSNAPEIETITYVQEKPLIRMILAGLVSREFRAGMYFEDIFKVDVIDIFSNSSEKVIALHTSSMFTFVFTDEFQTVVVWNPISTTYDFYHTHVVRYQN